MYFTIYRRELEILIGLRQNLFIPQMKLLSRQRIDGKVTKNYEMDIPLRRVLNLFSVEASKKEKLLKLRKSIDIVKLAENIERLTEELSNAYERKLRRVNNA